MSECFERQFEAGREMKSPFSRQLVVDFYDGTFTALVECAVCGRAYSCFIVDSDRKFRTRIFTLCPIEQDALKRLMELDIKAGIQPTGTYWAAPQVPAEIAQSLYRRASEILNSAGTPEWVIAANPYIDTIFAVKRVPNELVADVNASIKRNGAFDWMTFFGIPRD
jgi:hypothetical protein